MRTMLGGYEGGIGGLTLHDMAELIRRAGRAQGYEVQSEYRIPVGDGVAGKIDWVWLYGKQVVAAFEIEGRNAAPESLRGDHRKFSVVGACAKFVALYSVGNTHGPKRMPPRGMLPRDWIIQNWPEPGMPGVDVLLDTELMAEDGIERIQRVVDASRRGAIGRMTGQRAV